MRQSRPSKVTRVQSLRVGELRPRAETAHAIRCGFFMPHVVGLCTGGRPAPDRLASDRLGRCHLRHHTPQAVQDRGARHHQRPAHQTGHGIGLSLQTGLCCRSSRLCCCRHQLSRRAASKSCGRSRSASARPHLPACRAKPREDSLCANPVTKVYDEMHIGMRKDAFHCQSGGIQNVGVRYPG